MSLGDQTFVASSGGGGTPGGSNNDVQVNGSGAFVGGRGTPVVFNGNYTLWDITSGIPFYYGPASIAPQVNPNP